MPCLFSAALPQCQADDVRKFVPQLQEGNIEANQPVIDLLDRFAETKGATKAQISLAWMLRKRPNVIPHPRIQEQGAHLCLAAS